MYNSSYFYLLIYRKCGNDYNSIDNDYSTLYYNKLSISLSKPTLHAPPPPPPPPPTPQPRPSLSRNHACHCVRSPYVINIAIAIAITQHEA